MSTPHYDPSHGADDEFLAAQNEELYQALMTYLSQERIRWQWDEIDYSWTGKDADLEIHGHQGLHIDKIDDTWVWATVHTSITQ